MRLVKPMSLAVLLLLLVPVLASAQNARLAWRACPGAPGSTLSETFACNANTTPGGDPITFRLVGSFSPPSGLAQFAGLEAVVDIVTPEPLLPNWWRLGVGECREGSLNASLAYNAPGTCTNPFAPGGALGASLVWTSGYATPDRARLRVSVASNQVGPIVAGTSYTAFDLRLDAAHAVADGDPACAGCCTPACVLLSRIELYDSNGLAAVLDAFGGENVVGWNGQANVATPIGCSVVGGCPTRSGSHTWGAIKSLYR